MATISFHNGGGKARRDHNIRNPKTIKNQPHIDPEGEHEIWHDEKPREAYDRIFGESLDEYNDRQTRADRKIKSYYTHIEKDAKKHTVYETIIAVGSKANPVPREKCRTILREFCDGWHKRNPNLEVIGSYLHYTDEEGVPHVHQDYVPVATGYKNGMRKQNGLVRALGEMGFKKKGKATAQIQWENREREELERICRKHGIEIEHPEAEKKEHLETQRYKNTQEIARLKAEKENAEEKATQAKRESFSAMREAMAAKKEKKLAEEKAQTAIHEANSAREHLNRLRARYTSIAEKHNDLVRRYNTLLSLVKKLGIGIDEHTKAMMRDLER